MARFGSWVIVEPKFVKNTKVESLISRSLGGTLKLTTRGRVGFYFSVQTSFDHNLAIPKHAIPNQNILSPFLGLFDPFFGQKWRKIIFSAISKGFVTCSWYEDVLVVLNSLMVCLILFLELDHASGQVCSASMEEGAKCSCFMQLTWLYFVSQRLRLSELKH